MDRLGGKKEVERIFALNEDNMHVFLLEEPFTLANEAAAVAGTDAGVKQADTDAMTFKLRTNPHNVIPMLLLCLFNVLANP